MDDPPSTVPSPDQGPGTGPDTSSDAGADRGQGSVPSIDGRRFRAVHSAEAGEVDGETTFDYLESQGTIEARYGGGRIRSGYLLGTREGDELDVRYVHLNVDGETSSGHCHTRLELVGDGRIRMHENWEWESRPGSGTSVVEELHGAE